MESIEKLRTAARNLYKGEHVFREDCNLLCVVADEIEREIAEKYMEKPSLDDGPINVGDWIESEYDGDKYVRQVEALIWNGDRWDFQLSDEPGDTRDCASISDFYACSRHVPEPDHVKDLVREIMEYGHIAIKGMDHSAKVDEFTERLKAVQHG